MKALKNILVGFAISFIGSIPLGYLNVIGFQIYSEDGSKALNLYLIGVLLIEAIVIYSTLKLSAKIAMNHKWKNYISIFSFIFLLGIAFLTYSSSGNNNVNTSFGDYYTLPPLLIGIVLSCLNVAQIPFWMSWNLYLTNENYIITTKKYSFLYVLGTITGTYFGMLALILSLESAQNNELISASFFSKYIWLIFLILALFQLFQIIRNRLKNTKL